MNYEKERQQVLTAILEAVDQGLIHGTSGNIAVRCADGNVAITPSGIPYKGMTLEDIAIVDANGKWLEGNYKPSSETPMHTTVLRARPDIGATVHTHGMFCTIMAMSDEPMRPITPPQAEFTPVTVVPFTRPGSNDLAGIVTETLGEKGRVVLMKNHGMFACGKNIKAAMAAATYTEEMAQTTYYAKLLGTYEPMSQEAEKAMQDLIAADQAV